MGRRNWEDGVELVLEDLNAVTKAIERNLYDRIIYEQIERETDVFFGDSFSVIYSSATQVNVKKGVGFLEDTSQTTPEPEQRLLFRGADVTKTVAAPDATNDRIDIIVVKDAIVTETTGSRKYKDAGTGAITTETKILQKDWEAEVTVVAGTPAGSPSAPATPAGYIKVCEIEVTAVSGIANQAAITDNRTLVKVGGEISLDTTGFNVLTAGLTTTLDTLMLDIDTFLTAADFDDTTFSIQDNADPTKEIQFDAAGTTGTKTTITGSQTSDRVLTMPDASDTIVGKATTDTLTNKTIGDVLTCNDNVDVKGQAYSEEQATETPSGTTLTIDWDDGNSIVVDLGSASGDVTLTLSNGVAGASYVIKAIQGGTARNLVWPASVLWQIGVAPTISTGDDEEDLITLYFDGTNYYGNYGQNYS